MQQEGLSLLEFQKRFRSEKACQKHLFALRWPQGYRCPRCQHDQAYFHRTRHLYACKACGYQVSLTAGTIFHKTRTPLRKWFWMIFLMGRQKSGASILSLQRILEIRTYKTVWVMGHKIRLFFWNSYRSIWKEYILCQERKLSFGRGKCWV